VTLTAFTAAPKPAGPAGTWTVRPGDTLTSIATALAVPGGWQALYALNERVIGPRPDLIRAGTVLELPVEQTYTIEPGDTLASIARALGVRGGWQALYAANRQLIGTDPDLISPGATLALPSGAAADPERSQHRATAAPPATRTSPKATQATLTPRAPARGEDTTAGGSMPRWLKLILLLAALLALSSFLIEPVAGLARRRRRAAGAQAAGARETPSKSTIIQADHDRLVVTYSAHHDTVYLLTPPGEDPWSVLRAARVVVPEHTYVELADHLGVPSVWPYE
jgi:LysM repeat protein